MWVLGAGSIGCFVGGRLAAAGLPVTLIGRERVLRDIGQHGLHLTDSTDLTDPSDAAVHIAAAALTLREALPSPNPSTAPALVLLTVKSGATAEAARALATAVPSGTPALSLQNGVANAIQAAAVAPHLRWLPGMVPFNVAEQGPGHFHRGTSGELAAQDDPALKALQPWFAKARLPLHLHADLRPVQWAKLLLNLNNPVNALSGLPLREQLLQRAYRLITAALQDEALAAMRGAGIRPARVTPLPSGWLPHMLRLPTPLFRAVAAKSLRIDPLARSSMADDLARGRVTEIDALCGEVVRLAQAHGRAAPLNSAMCRLMEDSGAHRRLAAAELWRRLHASSA